MKRSISAVAACFAVALFWSATPAMAQATIVYDAIAAPLPGNVPSLGPEAYSFKEIGDKVTLAAGSRNLLSVDVLLSSWACQSGGWSTGDCYTPIGATFTHPITLNIYQADGTTLIGSVTQTFTIPYRPSPSIVCTGGRWSDGTTCFNGKAKVVTFEGLSGITLPDTFVFGITYNTSHFGYEPIGYNVANPQYKPNAPYDSLNVGLSSSTNPTPSVGTDASGMDGLYWDTSVGGFTCGGVALNTLKLDAGVGCWNSLDPVSGIWSANGGITIRFTTGVPTVAVNLLGFYSPIDNLPTLNKAKAGQTIPLKFYVATTAGAPVVDLASVNVVLATVPCTALASTSSDPVEQTVTGDSGLQNLGGGFYQWNWKTTKATLGCFVASLTLPSTYTTTLLKANFEFKSK